MSTSPGPRYFPTMTSTPATEGVVSMGSVVIADPRVHTGSDYIAVLDHDTLGGAGGSRGVHDAGQVVGFGRDGFGWVVLAEFDEVIETDDLQVRMRLGEGVDVLLLGVVLCAVDDDLDVLGLLHGVDEPGQQLWVSEHDLCVGLEHGVLEALLSECIVGGDNGHGLRERAWSRR